ncbi:MAG: hypothetical protein WCI59_12880 [Betaproteobacteria bacterium]
MRAAPMTGTSPRKFKGCMRLPARKAALAFAFAVLLSCKHALSSDAVEILRLVIEDSDVSTVSSFGDMSYLHHADGGYAVYQRVGDVSLISDSRPGRSGMAHHVGDAVVILRESSVSYCRVLGEVMRCHRL